ncbi:MAG TPA: ferredoxin [Bacteroidia bacterium]|nr:ferredoxin [Bacteroidia bacterium]
MSKVRILQRRDKCIGCNACVEAFDHRWRISRRDGKCTLIGSSEKRGIYSVLVDMDEYEANVIAAKNCPVRIITVEKI